MKAEELMIGDWIQTPRGPRTVKQNFGVDGVYTRLVPEYAEPEGFNEDEIEPIQLGINVFEKNGFEQTQICQFRNRSINVVVERIEPFQNAVKFKELYHWEVSIGDSYIGSISYVHELQHALLLCGIEKEIVL